MIEARSTSLPSATPSVITQAKAAAAVVAAAASSPTPSTIPVDQWQRRRIAFKRVNEEPRWTSANRDCAGSRGSSAHGSAIGSLESEEPPSHASGSAERAAFADSPLPPLPDIGEQVLEFLASALAQQQQQRHVQGEEGNRL